MKIWGEIPKVSGIYDKNKKLNKVDGIAGIATKKDVISISNQAKDFQTVMKALKDVPDVRQEKVKELTEKFETGVYSASGKDIADKILKSVLDKRV
ncbi:MAG: Anti-sigma-28 factor FlgM family protein [Clostridiales bacterium]|jgi:negative regulator of flagellin synthesis FlgM|nr:Anti-sigma-28 factor FlgM family protein [Clostridiales bacterium]